MSKKKTPLQTYNPARLLGMGTCEVTRVEGAMEGTETLCIQFFPYSWKYPVTVDLGDTDLEPFAPGTPWKEILKSAVETEFSFLGTTFHVCLRCMKYPDFGSEGVELALHTTFTTNVKSGIGVTKKPFAIWCIEAWNEEPVVKCPDYCMEVMNDNKVGLPELPGSATAKQKLAYAVAGRIVEQMNRNDPEKMTKAFISIHHHGDQVKPVAIYVAEGGLTGNSHYKSGSKVVEAVTEAISRVSCIERVDIEATFHEIVGTFAP